MLSRSPAKRTQTKCTCTLLWTLVNQALSVTEIFKQMLTHKATIQLHMKNMFCGFLSEFQSVKCPPRVPWITMHVCLLWWGERVPPLHHSPPSLQPVCVPLVGQLYHCPGPVHPGWGFCILLLGPEKAKRHPCLPSLLCI